MAHKLRLTRKHQITLTETAHRNLKRFCDETGLSADHALTFLFENASSVLHEETLPHRLRAFKAELAAQEI
ncbi:hypothetical protein KUV47_18980 [Vannielia litorea]|uniref:hypothetical protein n=1 Tax=Vannielia TaxID=2813041 RepID=UPI001C982287|nr:hypothetical protein [Vannielia litorea]MBY6050041.1 hypothetical protein [Vannielia litorea]MBY6077455.1 hypothetical protein [Vannielia litorea]MBY6155315.1 hypothetical protein [Vannielia litorea]